MKQLYKPLIKYTGGKFKDYDKVKKDLPEYVENYYEPFFGGGGFFFQLHNDNKINGKSYINDISKDLMNFYRCVGDDCFKERLKQIDNTWSILKDFAKKTVEKYKNVFIETISLNKEIDEFINDELKEFIINSTEIKQINDGIDFHQFSLTYSIFCHLKDKTKRFIGKQKKKGINENELERIAEESITTAICHGYYNVIRDMYNDWYACGNSKEYTLHEKSAQWFFIREMCFCSMFRYGADGKFNIPYGGNCYNNKDISKKINYVTSDEIVDLFRCNIDIQMIDFEDFLNRDYSENDFIFLDPPYDSTFSEYDSNSFTREDHIRLKNILDKSKAKYMMIIGKTDFIMDLYKDIHPIEYEKTYMYQARGEYSNKKTKHLVIKNY